MEQRNSVLEDRKTKFNYRWIDEKVALIPLARLLQTEIQSELSLLFSKERSIGEVEHKAAETAAGFLARQMEQ